VLAGVRDKTLNDLPEFQGLNQASEPRANPVPGVQLPIREARLSEIKVTIWEALGLGGLHGKP
jgi:hypothetical protein